MKRFSSSFVATLLISVACAAAPQPIVVEQFQMTPLISSTCATGTDPVTGKKRYCVYVSTDKCLHIRDELGNDVAQCGGGGGGGINSVNITTTSPLAGGTGSNTSFTLSCPTCATTTTQQTFVGSKTFAADTFLDVGDQGNTANSPQLFFHGRFPTGQTSDVVLNNVLGIAGAGQPNDPTLQLSFQRSDLGSLGSFYVYMDRTLNSYVIWAGDTNKPFDLHALGLLDSSKPALRFRAGQLYAPSTAAFSWEHNVDTTPVPLMQLRPNGSGLGILTGLAAIDATQLGSSSGNKVMASPANGSAGAMVPRSLVSADFPASGVTPGSYTNANVTVDATGRLTSVSNGAAGGGGGGYTTIDANGNPLTQRSVLNFGPEFNPLDNAGVARTDVTLATGSIANSKLATPSFTLNPGAGLAGGGTISLGGSGSLNLPTVGPGTTITFPSGDTITPDTFGRISAASTVTASAARGNLGLAIGTDVEAHDADLTAFAALGAGPGIPAKTGANAYALRVIAATAPLTITNPAGFAGDFTLACPTCVVTSGSYADPAWITSLATSKLTGQVAIANGGTNLSSAGGVANRALVTTDGTTFSMAQITNGMLASSTYAVGASGGFNGGSASLGGTLALTLTLSGDVTGLATATTVGKIQGKSIDTPTTKGDLFVYDGTALKRLPPSTDGFALLLDSAQTLGIKWALPPGGAPSGAAGGDLTGSTYPNPVLSKLRGVTFNSSNATPNDKDGICYVAGSSEAQWCATPTGSNNQILQWLAGTPSYAALNLSTASLAGTLPSTYGGLGINTSASSGVAKVATGTWSIIPRLTADLGGTNIDTSGSSGVPTISTGTWSVASNLATSLGGLGTTTAPSLDGQIPIATGVSGTYAPARLTAGSNITITNAAGSITIASSGGASGYATAQNAGSNLTQRSTINFASGLTAADNAGSTRTDVTFDTTANLTLTGVHNYASNTLKVDNGNTTNASLLASAASAARTATFPDATGTLAMLSLAQTWSAVQTHNNAGRLRINNSADTFYSEFTSGATANRTLTLPDITSTLAALGIAQSWSAAQTFLNAGPAKINNSADTFSSTLASAATANRTATLPDATGTLVMPGLAQSWGATQTFLNAGALRLNNSADTFYTQLATSASANRTATFPDATGTLAMLSLAQSWSAAQTFLNAGPAKINNSADTFSSSLASAATANRTFTLPDATDTAVGLAATQTLTNKTIVASSNTITGKFPALHEVVTAACQAGTASLAVSTGSANAPTPVCIGDTTGANEVLGAAEFTATGQFLQGRFQLPDDWVSGSGNDVIFDFRSVGTTGNTVWKLETKCAAKTGAVLPTTWNTGQTQSVAAQGTTLFTNSTTLSTFTTTGCSAGNMMYWKATLDASTTTTGNQDLFSIKFKLPRQVTFQ